MPGLNQLQQQIHNLFRQFISDIMFPVTGFVYNVDFENLRADVEISMPNSTNRHILEKVPIQIGSRGYSQCGPFVGDRVLVNFINGSIHSPIISDIYDYEHKEGTRTEQTKHERKGVLVPDYICNRQDWAIKDSSWDMEASW